MTQQHPHNAAICEVRGSPYHACPIVFQGTNKLGLRSIDDSIPDLTS